MVMVNEKKRDSVDSIIAYEEGVLDHEGQLDLFAELVRTGQAWTLQGHYGRVARTYIEEGFLRRDGAILKRADGTPVKDVPAEKPPVEPEIPPLTDKELSGNMSYNNWRPSLKPFEFVERREKVEGIVPKTGNKVVLSIISYGAYNACGLIGCEKGGVAVVMDAPRKSVLATRDIPYSMTARNREVERLLAVIRDEPNKADALVQAIKDAEGWEVR